MTPGHRSEDNRKSRPLLEPAFVSELERLSEAPKRANGNGGGAGSGTPGAGRRRGSTPASEPRRGINFGAARRDRLAAEAGAPEIETRFERGGKRRQSAHLPMLFRRLFKSRRGDLYLLIDSNESMEMRSEATGSRKWDQACRLAAAIGVAARARYARVHLVTLGQARGRRSPVLLTVPAGMANASGEERSRPLFATLGRQRPGGKGKFLTALDYVLRRAPEGSVCLVLSDFMTPEWEDGVDLLLDSRLKVSLLQILDPGDLDLAATGTLTLTPPSAEAGEPGGAAASRPLAVDPHILEGLRETFTRFCAELEMRCDEAGAGYFRTHTDEAFEKPLIEALRG